MDIMNKATVDIRIFVPWKTGAVCEKKKKNLGLSLQDSSQSLYYAGSGVNLVVRLLRLCRSTRIDV